MDKVNETMDKLNIPWLKEIEGNKPVCTECGKEIFANTSICDDCYDKKASKEKEGKRIEGLKDIFYEKCPPRFRNVGMCTNKTILNSENAIIWGDYGVGKTYLGWSLIKTLLYSSEIKTFDFMSEVELTNHFRRKGDHVNTTKHLLRSDLMIIDEYGKNNDTDFSKGQVYEVVNKRYEWEKRTIIICNADNEKQVNAMFSTGIMDRYKHNIIFMGGKSKR